MTRRARQSFPTRSGGPADPLELRTLANPFAPLQFRADMFAEMLPVLLAQMSEKGTTPAGMPGDLPLPTGPMGSLGSVGS